MLNDPKHELFGILNPATIKSVIKNPSYMAITTHRLKMLDIKNYLPPDASYESYLTTYLGGCQCEDKITCECGLGKGLFPFEYVSNFDVLNKQSIPPKSAFDSDFRGTVISDKDYERVKWVWQRYEMKSVKDLLVWYNNLDVKPFVQAIQKQREMYKEFGLDIFMDGVSLPGLAEKVMYATCYDNLAPIPKTKGTRFEFPRDRFNGYRNQDEVANREFNLTITHLNELLQKQGYSCSMCKCPLSSENVSADRINNTVGHIDGNITITCINCNVARKNMSISRFRRQKLIDHNADRLVYQIDKEYADIYYKMKANIVGGPSIIFNRYAKRNETFIRNGDKLVKKVIGYDANALYLWALGNEMPCGRLTSIEPYEGIVSDIINDKIFGFLECDIETPEDLKEYFSEMTPIFKNAIIDPCDRNVVGDHMYEFNLNSENKRTMKSKKLIGSYFGKQILIYTPLLKWYISHGLIVTKTYSFIKAKSHKPFQSFTDKVSNARRKGDADEAAMKAKGIKFKSVQAETMKLIGNSAFGRSGMDKSKHKQVKYKSFDDDIDSIIESNQFYDLEELDGSIEITQLKRSIKLNNPIHLSIAIYQLAKLRMLQFYYDCIDFYFDRSDFQYQEMDTDSAYISFSNEHPFQNLIKPELKDHFKQHKYDWFPREDSSENAAFDKRTPGLFKEEWRGDAMVSLASKNYYCYLPERWVDEKGEEAGYKEKASAKGVQKARNKGVMSSDAFESVIRTGISLRATNKGFRIDKTTQNVITYKTVKTGCSYYFDKRQVLADGISTIPLPI